jgi:hypothetical protein
LADLSGVEPEDFTRRQITEIQEIKPFVIETRQHHVTCPHCQPLNRVPLPPGLEAECLFGPQLEATVVWYKQKQLMSYERLVVTLWERPRHATFGFRNERLRSAVCRGDAPSRNHPSLP